MVYRKSLFNDILSFDGLQRILIQWYLELWWSTENPYSMISWALMVYFNRNYRQHRHHVKPWYQLWRTVKIYKDRSFWRALSVDDLGRYWAWETSICHGPSTTRISYYWRLENVFVIWNKHRKENMYILSLARHSFHPQVTSFYHYPAPLPSTINIVFQAISGYPTRNAYTPYEISVIYIEHV